MKIERLLYLLLLVVVSACSVDSSTFEGQVDSKDEEGTSGAVGAEEVVVAVAGAANTRLSIYSDDGSSATVRWDDEDAIYLWAQGESGDMAFSNTQFNVKYYGEEFSEAIFTSTVNSMSESSYTYWGAYPQPESVEGDVVKYTLSAVQCGKYGSNYEILAMPKGEGAALSTTVDRGFVMNFSHLTHIMRFELPSGSNSLGEEISSLTFEFPTSVVGAGSVDFASEQLDFTLDSSDGTNNSVVVTFDEPFDAGDDYIWINIAPCEMVGDISYFATSVSGVVSEVSTIADVDRTMSAGRITPATLAIAGVDDSYKTYNIEIDGNNLGEEIDIITLTAPSGAYFKGEAGNVSEITLNVIDGVSDLFTLHDDYISTFQSGGITAKYDSKSAIVSGTIAGSNLSQDGGNVLADVPYLFEEDFSSFSTLSTSTTHGQISSTNWYRERAQVWSGVVSIQPYNYREFSITSLGYIYTQYMAKLTSAPLSNLKSSADAVDIIVSYGADWNDNKFSNMSLDVGLSATTGAVTDEMTSVKTISLTNSSAGSSTTTLTAREAELSGAESTHRISWKSNSSSSSGSSGTDNIYIRNVKVSIK